MKRVVAIFFPLLLAGFLAACNGDNGGDTPGGGDTTAGGGAPTPPPPADTTPVYGYEVVKTYPHDTSAFTQGLLFHEGELLESTGQHGLSSLRKVELATGKVLNKVDVPTEHFAEGLALLNGKLYQLTWRSAVCFVYDLNGFRMLDTMQYYGEGWGITTDGTSLIMSDGTNALRFLDPATFQVKRTVGVFRGDKPVLELNELEWVNGEVWANVWRTEQIVRIDPTSGAVKGIIDLSGLLPAPDRTAHVDVMNGIAYDQKGGRLFVTGKNWPKLFEITLKQKNPVIAVQ